MPSRDRDLRSDELRQSLQFLLDELYAQGELILPKEYMRALVSEHTRDIEPDEARLFGHDDGLENERLRERIDELERDYARERKRNRTLSERVERYNDERRCGSSSRRRRSSGGTCGSSSSSYCGSIGVCGS